MKRKTFFIILAMVATQFSYAQKVMNLWSDVIPGDNQCPQSEETLDGKRVRFVSVPTLTVYLPEKENNSGAAVIICPGGGYVHEAMDHEGYQYAAFLQSKGVAGIVLKYRLPYGHHEIPLMDAQQAIRMVRYHAIEWGIDPEKVGISGFSAGGHLASTAATHFDAGKNDAVDPVQKVSCRPDFAVLVYPVITFNEQWGHMGSRENLIGKGSDLKLIHYYSNERHVTPQTPPTFLVLADDDKGVPPRNSIEYYLALKENGVPAELHIFREGGHGFGMRKSGKPHDQWPILLLDWMHSAHIVK